MSNSRSTACNPGGRNHVASPTSSISPGTEPLSADRMQADLPPEVAPCYFPGTEAIAACIPAKSEGGLTEMRSCKMCIYYLPNDCCSHISTFPDGRSPVPCKHYKERE